MASPAQPHVVLVGLMGTGKSSIGRPVAEALGRDLVDSDSWIEARTGKTVRELWEDGGEAAYRPLERQALLEALDADEPLVVAAAAGTILEPDLRERLAADDAFVVFLEADPGPLAATVGAKGHRPLVGDDPGPLLEAMAAERDPLYREVADLVVDTDSMSRDEAVDLILRTGAGRDPGAATPRPRGG